MTPSDDETSHRRRSNPGTSVMVNGGLPKEVCSRVRKACNRCRLRKVKCNGRIPCTRCEQDHATCKINHDMVGLKDLKKSYIASLEEQQISLLSALRDLHRRAPHNSDVCDTIEQLQRKGFDINSLNFKEPQRSSHENEAPMKHASPTTRPALDPYESTQLTMGYLQSLLEQPTTPQIVSDFLWHCGDASHQNAIQHNPQPTQWQSANSYFGMAPSRNVEPVIEPSSGLLIDPTAFSFGLDNSRVASG